MRNHKGVLRGSHGQKRTEGDTQLGMVGCVEGAQILRWGQDNGGLAYAVEWHGGGSGLCQGKVKIQRAHITGMRGSSTRAAVGPWWADCEVQGKAMRYSTGIGRPCMVAKVFSTK